MCRYTGIWYYECQHICFQLSIFCRDLFDELLRLDGDPTEDEKPKGESPRSCLPRILTRDGVVVMKVQDHDGGATNIDQWVTDLAESCPSCARNYGIRS
ncbi:hypothetical protein N7520_008782 [Penicillium odoratum]|uniref:uncharacterized protein n=1 Tax=Penicillium odoratum TaxID=1167516 RepID=UPI002548D0FE|nr:uncharacterized protein N7520_008782 [Penicillium odoratum]KAJ5751865.1 hypothetical protein N7520_008782 [Penicillium odoratum]